MRNSIFITILIMLFFNISYGKVHEKKTDIDILIKDNLTPNYNRAMSNIDKTGPYLLNAFCHYFANYLDSSKREAKIYICNNYIKLNDFLKNLSTGTLNDLYISNNGSDELNLRALNWNIGAFTTDSTHSQIIEAYIKRYILKRLMIDQLDDFKEYLDIRYRDNYLSARSVEMPLLKAFLSSDNSFVQNYAMLNSIDCTDKEIMCHTKLNELRLALDDALFINGGDNNLFSELIITHDRISNFQPTSWEEARNLDLIYQSNDIFSHLNSLEESALLNILRSPKEDEKVQAYIEKVKELSKSLTNLSELETLELMRSLVEFHDAYNVAKKVEILKKEEKDKILQRYNQLVSKIQSNELLNKVQNKSESLIKHNQEELVSRWSEKIYNSQITILNTIGYFYQEKENAILN